MIQSSTPLTRQLSRWKRQADSGDLPDEIYDLISHGAVGVEKKQITNLARVSRVISESGEIRPYNEFKHDWRFEKSIYGKHQNKCLLCGKHPIVENCVLEDHVAEKKIVVGSTCVNRYVEITVDGRILEGDEKERWVRDNMSEAKKVQRKTDFAQRWPNIMGDLKKFEPMMKEKAGRSFSKWGSRVNWVRPELARLHRTVSKRVITHGYLGAKTNGQWTEFMEIADDQFRVWSEQKAIEARRKESLRIEAEEKRKRLQQKIAEKRSLFADQAQKFSDQTEEWILSQGDWSQRMRGRVIQKIRNQGLDRLDGGFREFYNTAVRSTDPTIIKAQDPEKHSEDWNYVHWNLRHNLSTEPYFSQLNEWEKQFIKSITTWSSNRQLTPKQEKSYVKICRKLSLKAYRTE